MKSNSLKSKPTRYFTTFVFLLLGAFSANAQDTTPDPASPPAPTEYSQCDDLEDQWDELFKNFSEMHEDCLKSAEKAKEKRNPKANFNEICDFPSCQSLHTRKEEIGKRKFPAVSQCRAKVRQYKEAESRRKAEEAERQARLESERRRAEQERREAEMAEREAAQKQIRDRQRAETQRRESAAEQAAAKQRANEEARQRVLNSIREAQEQAEERSRAIDAAVAGAFAPIMAALESRRQRIEAEQEEADARAELAAAEAAARERERLEIESRKAAEAAARRAREGAYTRSILEADAVEREKAEQARVKVEEAKNKSSLVDPIEAEMMRNSSAADDVFGSDARDSINRMERSLKRLNLEREPEGTYGTIEPPSGSLFRKPFEKVTNQLEAIKKFIAGPTDSDMRGLNLLTSRLMNQLAPKEAASRLKNRVYRFAITRLWQGAVEIVRDIYARQRATPKGESIPDPVMYEYYRAEAAAHPATGFGLELLRSGGVVPVAVYRSLKELVNRTVKTVGLVGTEALQ